MIRQASVRSDARCHSLKLASPQRVEEVAHENDALALPVGEALPDQVRDASIHRVSNLAANPPELNAAGSRATSWRSSQVAPPA